MRLALLLNRDIHSNWALNLLLPRLAAHDLVVFLSERVGGMPQAPPAALLGQLGFVEQDLWNDLVFPSLGLAGDSRGPFLSFEEVETRRGIPVRPVASARTAEGLAMLAGAQADLFISIRFGKILDQRAIGLPRLGVLNLHSGLLPNYRGVLATLRALLHGDAVIGCTLYRIDTPGIDTGPIVTTATLPVDPRRSLFWHVHSLYPLGVELIAAAVAQLERGGHLACADQLPGEGAYFSFPTDADLIDFTAAGWRLFDRQDIRSVLAAFRDPAYA